MCSIVTYRGIWLATIVLVDGNTGIGVCFRPGTGSFHKFTRQTEQPLDIKYDASQNTLCDHSFRPLVIRNAHQDNDTATTIIMVVVST